MSITKLVFEFYISLPSNALLRQVSRELSVVYLVWKRRHFPVHDHCLFQSFNCATAHIQITMTHFLALLQLLLLQYQSFNCTTDITYTNHEGSLSCFISSFVVAIPIDDLLYVTKFSVFIKVSVVVVMVWLLPVAVLILLAADSVEVWLALGTETTTIVCALDVGLCALLATTG